MRAKSRALLHAFARAVLPPVPPHPGGSPLTGLHVRPQRSVYSSSPGNVSGVPRKASSRTAASFSAVIADRRCAADGVGDQVGVRRRAATAPASRAARAIVARRVQPGGQRRRPPRRRPARRPRSSDRAGQLVAASPVGGVRRRDRVEAAPGSPSATCGRRARRTRRRRRARRRAWSAGPRASLMRPRELLRDGGGHRGQQPGQRRRSRPRPRRRPAGAGAAAPRGVRRPRGRAAPGGRGRRRVALERVDVGAVQGAPGRAARRRVASCSAWSRSTSTASTSAASGSASGVPAGRPRVRTVAVVAAGHRERAAPRTSAVAAGDEAGTGGHAADPIPSAAAEPLSWTINNSTRRSPAREQCQPGRHPGPDRG